MLLRPAACLALVCCAVSVMAQQYGFRRFTPQDGLAQSQVRCMAQDARGYLWFGTLGGASRFDGHEFTNYALQEGLPDAQVNAMLATRDGTFWLASGSYLTIFDGHRMRPVRLPETMHGARILTLAEDEAGALLVGTDGAGVFRASRSGFEPLPGYPSDTAISVRALFALPDGDVLIGLRNGLLRWHDGVCVNVPLPEQPSISALATAPDGTIWVGTFGQGLYGLRPNGDMVVHDESNGLLQENIRALLVDRRGRLWIATKFGVDLLENGRLRAFTVHQGMPNDNISCIAQDAEGGLWFGTDGSGAMRYAGDRFVTFTVTEGLCSDLVMTVVGDRHGDLWLGSYSNGICRLDGMATITTLDGLPNNTIWSSLADPDGSLWFGTGDGLCHVVNGRVAKLDSAQALLGQKVFALHRAKDGRLWCGTREGIAIVTPGGGVEHIDRFGDVTIRSVRTIHGSSDGWLWLSTEQGVVRVRSGQAQRFTTAEGLSDNAVFCLVSDPKGRLWAGTSNGVCCIEPGKPIQVIRFGQDFSSNYVDLLLADAKGDLWAGTNNGIYRFTPDSLLLDHSAVEHITTDDGLRGMECNLNAGFRDARGRLFIGTNAGLVLHDPARSAATSADQGPAAYITGLRSFLQPTDWSASSDSTDSVTGLPVGLHVAYRKNHLTFDYTAIALADGDHVRFQYRLNGFDGDWLPATDARFASYSNLPHGDYSFEVRAADHAANWGPPARLEFRITPPFWLRWWFFGLCALALAAIGYGVLHVRHMRRLRREKTMQLMLRSRMLQLEQQALNANMNRHFIFNALNSIQYYINRQDRTAANKYLTSFAKLIRKNLDASQNDTTSLAEELSRLDLYLLLEHMRFKDKFRYTVTVDPAVDTRNVELPAMMLQPYVENSIWHGILPMDRQGTVAITVSPAGNGRTQVRITDDGIGIERSLALKNGGESDHISRGIEITKGRADVLRKLSLADIRITGPEQIDDQGIPVGTQVIIELPLRSGGDERNGHLQTATNRHTFESP